MKRAILLLVSIALLTAGTVISVSADNAAQISPALQILSKQIRLKKTSLSPADVTFSADDFDRATGLRVSEIRITSLPPTIEGTLAVGTVAVMRDQVISRRELGELRFIAMNGVTDSRFTFRCAAMQCAEDLECEMFLLTSQNQAPTGAFLSEPYITCSTYGGMTYYGRLHADDAESDPLSYEIVNRPQHGTVRLKNAETGEYSYSPVSGFDGSDSFTYRATDRYGNSSEEIRVTVHVAKDNAGIVFSDMENHPALPAAVTLVRSGIMTGDLENGQVKFSPDATVSRAEFCAMAMKAAGYTVIGYRVTPYADDASIPTSCRGYVCAAVEKGFLTVADGAQVDFEPERAVTRAEAAMMLRQFGLLHAATVHAVYADQSEAPDGSLESLYAMHELGAVTGFGDSLLEPNAALTRAQCATILSYVMK